MEDCKNIIDELYDYADGMLPEERAGQIQEHLSGCPECAREYERIKEIKAELKKINEPVPQELNGRVMHEVGVTYQMKKKRFIPMGTIAAAMIALVFLSFSMLNPSGIGCSKSEDNSINYNKTINDEIWTQPDGFTDSASNESGESSTIGPDYFGILDGFKIALTDDVSVIYVLTDETIFTEISRRMDGKIQGEDDNGNIVICFSADEEILLTLDGYVSSGDAKKASRDIAGDNRYIAVLFMVG